ncbi:MAG: thiamine phosphate synthase [Limnochordia bacterium]|jgi:thiamine-phosphate pyrophosphorylase
MKVDYTLYAITDDAMAPELLPRAVEEAILGGATIVQLRKKNITTREYLHLAQAVKEATDRHGIPLIINDRLDIALAVDAAGLHVGDDDLPVDVARRLLGPTKILGVSADSPEKAKTAEAQGATYLGVGAVYPTPSKADAGPPIGLSGLSQVIQAASLPVVAIGGINLANCYEVRKQGAAGMAVISALFGAPDIKSAAAELRRAWDGIQ